MAVANTALNTINNGATAASKDPAIQPSNSNLSAGSAAALILTQKQAKEEEVMIF
jgi:hypothetical protein